MGGVLEMGIGMANNPSDGLSMDSLGNRGGAKYAYVKLPSELMCLSVLKMDNTSFDVRVGSTASVYELKRAVEATFNELQVEQGTISWSHVWGNFCLSYKSQILVDDQSLLSSFGIRDSDQLCFVRYISSKNRDVRSDPRKHGKFRAPRNKSSDGSNVHGDIPATQIKLHWAHVLRTWFMYSKLWIMGLKSDWKNTHLRQ